MKNVKVFDSAGRLVFEIDHVGNNEATIDLSTYVDGVYFIHIDEQTVKVMKR